MSPEERERITELCRKIQSETNHNKLSELAQQLSAVLDRKNEERRQAEHSGGQPKA